MKYEVKMNNLSEMYFKYAKPSFFNG